MAKEQGGDRGFTMSDSDDALPQMTFTHLVLSLSTSALVHMGAAPEGEGAETGAPEKNLPLAKQTIDILEMLQEKTRGNLEAAEEALLEQVIHEVHLKYVEVSPAK